MMEQIPGFLWGVLASAIVALAFWYIPSRWSYPGKIVFVKEKSVNLFAEISRGLSSLSINYNGKPVEKNIILVSGSIWNDGRLDITPDLIEKPITITLPPDHSWLEVEVLNAANGVSATIDAKKQEIEIKHGLFKCNEYIRFQALIQVPIDSPALQDWYAWKVIGKMKLNHRIANIGKIKYMRYSSYHSKDSAWDYYSMLIMVAAFSIITPFVFDYGTKHRCAFEYSYTNNINQTMTVSAAPRLTQRVALFNKDSGIIAEIPLNDFVDNVSKSAKIVKNNNMKWNGSILMWIVLFCFAVLNVVNLVRHKKQNRLKRALEIQD